MLSSLCFRILRPVFVGHLSGFGALLVLAMVALFLTDPTAAALPLALAALFVGAFVCALVSRKLSLGLLPALLAGLVYALIPWIASLFHLGESAGGLSFGRSTLSALLLWLVAVLPALLIPKKKSGASLAKRRRAMQNRMR